MKFGSILKACRDRAGLNQEELAYRLHINQSDVSKYETGAKEPTISIFKEWATATQAQEVMIAFILGIDGVGMMQQVMDVISTTVVNTILGGIL